MLTAPGGLVLLNPGQKFSGTKLKKLTQNFHQLGLTNSTGRWRMPRPEIPLYHTFEKKSSKFLKFSSNFHIPRIVNFFTN